MDVRTRLVLLATLAAAVLGTAACTGSGGPEQESPSPAAPAATAPEEADCDLSRPEPPCALWTLQGVQPPLAAGPGVVLRGAGRAIVGHAPDTGAQLWERPSEGSRTATAALVTATGVLVVSTDITAADAPSAMTTLLDPATGADVWTVPGFLTSLDEVTGVVAVLDGDELVVVDLADGRPLWRRPSTSPLGPSFDDGEALVGNDTTVALVDARDGTVRWELDRAGVELSLGARGGALGADVALVTLDTGRDLVDRTTGASLTEGDLPPRLEVVDGAVVALQEVAVTGVATDGAVQWSVDATPLVARGGTALLVGAERDGSEALGLVDPATGDLLWRVQADRDVGEVVADDDHVAITRTGSVVLHDRRTGDELQTVTAPDATILSLDPFVISTADTLAVVTSG